MVDGCRSTLVNVVSGVPQGSVLGQLLFLLYTSELFPFWKISWSVMLMTSLWWLFDVVPSPGVRVAVAESLIRDLGRVSEWCELWGMKLKASKTKTMIVTRSLTMHHQSPPLTIGGTVRSLMTLLYWEWHLIPKLPLRSIFARFPEQLLKDLVSWLSPGECSMMDRFLGDTFGVLSCQFWTTVLQSGARLPIHTLNYWTVQSVVPSF